MNKEQLDRERRDYDKEPREEKVQGLLSLYRPQKRLKSAKVWTMTKGAGIGAKVSPAERVRKVMWDIDNTMHFIAGMMVFLEKDQLRQAEDLMLRGWLLMTRGNGSVGHIKKMRYFSEKALRFVKKIEKKR